MNSCQEAQACFLLAHKGNKDCDHISPEIVSCLTLSNKTTTLPLLIHTWLDYLQQANRATASGRMHAGIFLHCHEQGCCTLFSVLHTASGSRKYWLVHQICNNLLLIIVLNKCTVSKDFCLHRNKRVWGWVPQTEKGKPESTETWTVIVGFYLLWICWE